eukprot:scaffold6503_cov60-Phaeocystis_antarctica.AAC.2
MFWRLRFTWRPALSRRKRPTRGRGCLVEPRPLRPRVRSPVRTGATAELPYSTLAPRLTAPACILLHLAYQLSVRSTCRRRCSREPSCIKHTALRAKR